MISAFSIILEDKILYCSKKKRYNAFEVVLFIEKFLKSINPKKSWRLKEICLKNKKTTRKRIIVNHILTKDNQNLFFCIIGNYNVGSQVAIKMLKDFSKQVTLQYHNPSELQHALEEPAFKKIIKLITDYLKDRYLESLEEEFILEKTGNTYQNTILYSGISVQGLPIISQLYDKDLLRNLKKENTNENIELFSSDLSAKLATISMNTQIRTKKKIKEIHIIDDENKESNKIFFFGNIKKYSLDFFASGNFYKLKDIFKQLKAKLVLDTVFKEEFSGDLKPFKHLKQYLNEEIKEFDL